MNIIVTDHSAVSGKAMLVRLTISQWGGKALDKSVTAEVARQHGISSDAGRYNKVLVAKAVLDPVTKAVGAMRAHHYENTLPWLDDGARILPAANFFSYRESMAGLKDVFDRAVANLIRTWPDVITEARSRLGNLYRAADYPSDIGRMFGVRVGFLPFPDADDFRVDLSGDVAAQMRAVIAADVQAASASAVKDCYARITDVVGRMSERLKAYRIDPDTDKVEGVFRDSLVSNVRELADILPRLNFTEDANLDRLARQLAESLGANDADVLRNHESKRLETIAAADSILASLGGYLG